MLHLGQIQVIIRANKNTPVTIMPGITHTGVGAFIASGNQACK
jgi:hypothetical protein